MMAEIISGQETCRSIRRQSVDRKVCQFSILHEPSDCSIEEYAESRYHNLCNRPMNDEVTLVGSSCLEEVWKTLESSAPTETPTSRHSLSSSPIPIHFKNEQIEILRTPGPLFNFGVNRQLDWIDSIAWFFSLAPHGFAELLYNHHGTKVSTDEFNFRLISCQSRWPRTSSISSHLSFVVLFVFCREIGIGEGERTDGR